MVRSIAAGVLIAMLAAIGAGYGVLCGITLATVVITNLDNTVPYRLMLTAAGAFGGVIGAACNVSLGLVVHGFILTIREIVQSRRSARDAGGK